MRPRHCRTCAPTHARISGPACWLAPPARRDEWRVTRGKDGFKVSGFGFRYSDFGFCSLAAWRYKKIEVTLMKAEKKEPSSDNTLTLEQFQETVLQEQLTPLWMGAAGQL